MMGGSAGGGHQIAVVIPTHNRAPLLPRAIDSVLAQTHSALDVIVVDDASTDRTIEVLEQYPDVRVIRLPVRRGGAHARNAGVEASEAPFIAFLDSDDEWLPDKLQRQLPLFGDNPNLGAVYCRFIAHDDRTGVSREQHPPLYRGRIRDILLSGRCPRSTTLFVVRREAFDDVGGFDVELPGFQDTDLWIRMSADWDFDAVDEALAVVHSHSGHRVTTDVEARQAALDAFLGKWEVEMAKAIGQGAVSSYRSTHMAVALGAKVLESAELGQRREAARALGTYLREVGVRRPKQLAGLVLAVVAGGRSHTQVKGWMQRR